ncbi:MAG: biopolymer transport protein ExbB/TolQ [Polyangiales bacterium]|jgi:biopolymer transport protein ExbB/TolQ
MDIQERLTAFAMLGAEWVMWLLILLSVVCVAIILERAYYFFSSRDDARALQALLRGKLKEGDTKGAASALKKSASFEARVALAALEVIPSGAEAVEERIRGERIMAKAEMERNLAFLGTVGNNAPFVGLLGTVIGIIQAFAALNASQGQVTTDLMATVGEALVATAIGILVALPAVAAYNYYQRVIKGRLVWADALGSDVLVHLRSKNTAREDD